jgi:hypothetical protein
MKKNSEADIEAARAIARRLLERGLREGMFASGYPFGSHRNRGVRLFIKSGQPIPQHLYDLWETLDKARERAPRRKRGRPSRASLQYRDQLISVVIFLVKTHGFHATRNPLTRNKLSACDIVEQVLKSIGVRHMSVRRLIDIWKASPLSKWKASRVA